MPYLSRIEIAEYCHLKNLVIDCGQDGQNLILTGPNGSGKSSIISAVWKKIKYDYIESFSSPLSGLTSGQEISPGINIYLLGTPIAEKMHKPEHIFACFDAFRKPEFQRTPGPKNDSDINDLFYQDQTIGKHFLQILVNKRMQQAYATIDDDHQAVEVIEKWFDQIQTVLKHIFEDDAIRLRFERDKFLHRIEFGDGRILDFDELADGHKAAISIVADLLIRKDIVFQKTGIIEPDGIVLIDEIENHLHLHLQEVILPLLCGLFPKIQFIVATHSPAVIASVDHAIIYDLQKQQPISSDNLRGIRYGTLMTSHFGISSDFDLKTTAELEELMSLYRKDRNGDEDQRMRDLAEKLSDKSHALALEILLQLKSFPALNA